MDTETQNEYTAQKDNETNLWGVYSDGGIIYDSQFSEMEAKRIVTCLEIDGSLTWNEIRDYVEGETNVKPRRKRVRP